MNWVKKRTFTEWLVLAVLILAATCCILAIKGSPGIGDNRATAAISDDPSQISSIRLQAAIKPARVRVGQQIKIAAMISVTGGPGPVTYSFKFPDQNGHTYTGSLTTMIDRNGTYGFETPPVKVDFGPGVYSYTLRVSSGAVQATRTVVLTVDPDPSIFVP